MGQCVMCVIELASCHLHIVINYQDIKQHFNSKLVPWYLYLMQHQTR